MLFYVKRNATNDDPNASEAGDIISWFDPGDFIPDSQKANVIEIPDASIQHMADNLGVTFHGMLRMLTSREIDIAGEPVRGSKKRRFKLKPGKMPSAAPVTDNRKIVDLIDKGKKPFTLEDSLGV